MMVEKYSAAEGQATDLQNHEAGDTNVNVLPKFLLVIVYVCIRYCGIMWYLI